VSHGAGDWADTMKEKVIFNFYIFILLYLF